MDRIGSGAEDTLWAYAGMLVVADNLRVGDCTQAVCVFFETRNVEQCAQCMVGAACARTRGVRIGRVWRDALEDMDRVVLIE